MVIMNDLEQPLLSYYVIYFEKFRNVMQRTEKEALSWYDQWMWLPDIIPMRNVDGKVKWPQGRQKQTWLNLIKSALLEININPENVILFWWSFIDWNSRTYAYPKPRRVCVISQSLASQITNFWWIPDSRVYKWRLTDQSHQRLLVEPIRVCGEIRPEIIQIKGLSSFKALYMSKWSCKYNI